MRTLVGVRTPSISILLLATLVGCGGPATPAPAGPSLAEQVAAARERMHTRFVAASAIERAIGLGDLTRARAEAARIVALEEPEFLPEWKPYVDDIRAAAGRVAGSADTIVAAHALSQLGRACGRCHEASHAKIAFPSEPAPSADAGGGPSGASMAAHQWAAARMWEGVIGPDADRWVAGARLLATAPLAVTAESGALGIADDVARTHLFAERAVKLAPGADAELYGDLLATCAHCHATIRQP